MKKSTTLLLLAAVLLFAACGSKNKSRHYNPQQVAFKASYNSMYDNIVYPSMVLALANYSGPEHQELFAISVVAPENNAVLRVVVDSTRLNYVTILQEVLPRKGETYTFYPSVKWKYDKLYHKRQQSALDLTFTCYINDEEVDVKNLRLNVRSVSDCPITLADTAGHHHDYRWLFMGYVNEEHPYIDSILTAILSQGNVSTFSGYQRGSAHVLDQVFSVWYYALDRGITYSSITCTTNPSKRSSTQHIRFFDEVYNSRQANCIDACVFFASILRKIGIKTFIVLEPCHAYLGYYTDKSQRQVKLLETTITAWINIPAMKKDMEVNGHLSKEQLATVSKYLSKERLKEWNDGKLTFEQLEQDVVRELFKRATEYQTDDFNANRANFADTNMVNYQMLRVDDLRKVVQPISAL